MSISSTTVLKTEVNSIQENLEPEDTVTLSFEQVEKLNRVLHSEIEINGVGNFPTLNVQVKDLVQKVLEKLKDKDITVSDIRLNGSAASYILCSEQDELMQYNDVDLIYSVELPNEETLLGIKDLVLECLYSYLPSITSTHKLGYSVLQDAYVAKLTKVWDNKPNGDKWSLISLSNAGGLNIELKFVHNMKRKFQFSVDSFQIILDSMFTFADVSADSMTKDFFPSVTVQSMYGDIQEALTHLNHRLIATHSPSHIKGGGLLKYCDLISRSYSPIYEPAKLENVEKTMCTRFFIDYPETQQQQWRIQKYLHNHFSDFQSMLNYLYTLFNVVRQRTVCLMGHERRMALELICGLIFSVQVEQERQWMCWYDSDGSSMCYSSPGSLSPTTPSSLTDLSQSPFAYPNHPLPVYHSCA